MFQEGVDDQSFESNDTKSNKRGQRIDHGFSKVEIVSDPDRRVLVDLYLLC